MAHIASNAGRSGGNFLGKSDLFPVKK